MKEGASFVPGGRNVFKPLLLPLDHRRMKKGPSQLGNWGGSEVILLLNVALVNMAAVRQGGRGTQEWDVM